MSLAARAVIEELELGLQEDDVDNVMEATDEVATRCLFILEDMLMSGAMPNDLRVKFTLEVQ